MKARFHYATLSLLLLLVTFQARGQQFFEPSCGKYFPQAVKQIGLVPGILSTADRITRTGRISAADRPVLSPDHLVHEGPEAYSKRLRYAQETSTHTALSEDIPSGNTPVGGDLEFINYLLDNGMLREARAMLSLYSPSDTLNYLRGWTAYNSKFLEEAAEAFSHIGADSPFYDRAVFYGSVCNAYTGDLETARERLQAYSGPLTELRDTQLKSIGAIMSIPPSNKKPLLAAGLSTVVPGLGKIYAGRLGEGISALLINGVLAAITADQWVHNGPSDWKTIAFGSLGAIFYIGNIYGSYHSVSIYDHEDRLYRQNDLLYNLHIAVRDRLR